MLGLQEFHNQLKYLFFKLGAISKVNVEKLKGKPLLLDGDCLAPFAKNDLASLHFEKGFQKIFFKLISIEMKTQVFFHGLDVLMSKEQAQVEESLLSAHSKFIEKFSKCSSFKSKKFSQ